MQKRSYFVDSQTQVAVQQSTLTSVTLERDELTEEKAALEHKFVTAESQIDSLQVSTVKGTTSRQIQWLDVPLVQFASSYMLSDTL